MPLAVDERCFAPVPEEPDARPIVLTVGKDLASRLRDLARGVARLDAASKLVAHPRNLVERRAAGERDLRRQVGFTELRERTLERPASCCRSAATTYRLRLRRRRPDRVCSRRWRWRRPIVATDRAILRDYVDDGVEALLVPPEDPVALRAAIDRVLGDPELARSLGLAARARVERAHTSREFAARLAPVLRSVV